jgi:aspartate-semialdehyde dehydrogenase
VLQVLEERGFPISELVPFASERSQGKPIRFSGRELECQTLGDVEDFDLSFMAAGGSISREWAPRFVDGGALVIDKTSHWRMDPQVPLVVPEINPDATAEAFTGRGIISSPNCSTMALVMALYPLHRKATVEEVVVSTYQSVSGTGVRAVQELEDQTHRVLHEQPMLPPEVYPHPIAFNVLGGAGNFAEGDDHTDEERKMMFETRKILGDPDIRIAVTCARVPVRTCHSESVSLETRDELSVEQARELLAGAPGLALVDDPASHTYPTALSSAGRDEVFVGRLRRDPSHPRGLQMWVVSDNLLKGAATNAVQIAEVLHDRGLVRVPTAV